MVNFLFFSVYDTSRHYKDSAYPYWSQIENTLYIAFERFLFGLGISLIFLPLLLGHFTIISNFLSLYPWSIMYLIYFYILIFIFSFPFVLIVEMPPINLEKLLMNQSKKMIPNNTSKNWL